MSNPSNILSSFRTYSYHHILIVTDGIKTASQLGEHDDIVLFNRDTRTGVERFAPRYLGPNETMGYVVLIDGMKDIQFSIQSAKWETILAPHREQGGQKYADTVEVDGQFEILEPHGIRFLEILANASRDLGTDPSGLIFVLKTIFVGHTDSNTQELISNVRPFMFMMTDISAVIDNSGATYNMEVVGVNNGVAKLPQISSVADGINLLVSTSDTVSAGLKKLEQQINDRYAKFKSNLATQLKQAGSALDLSNDFREVEYRINTDPVYETAAYKVADNINIASSSTPGTAIIASGRNSTVESMIRKVLESSAQIAADSAGKNSVGKKFIFKIVSTLLPDDDNDKYVVQYSVHRFEIITQQPGKVIEPAPGEFIEFDYIFTGRNIDVLEFDIKMDMGLSFFQTLATSRNLPSDQKSALNGIIQSGSSVGSQGGTANAANATKTKPPRRSRTPLFLGTTIKDPIVRNKTNPLDSATFDALLTRHAAFENVEASMKIAGNPQLLDELLPTPEEVITGGTETSKPGTTGSNKLFRTPGLVKVNVKFPATTELTGTRDFWYRGFYNLFSVTQVFDGGLFTQELQMFSLPQDDGTSTALSTETTKQPVSTVANTFVPTTEKVDRTFTQNAPRNFRNNNPLNIEKTDHGRTPWRGEVPHNTEDTRFALFTEPTFGIRAGAYLLRVYYNRYGLTTVNQIINRWAPVADNSLAETTNYVSSVAAALGVGINDTININTDDQQLIAMIKAMSKVESGGIPAPYPEEDYTRAIELL